MGSRPSWLNWLLALNALGLILAVLVCGGMAVRLGAKYGRVQRFAASVQAGDAELMRNAAGLLHATAGDFFLGASDGALAAFLTNQFAGDFGGLARNVTALADAVFAEYRNATTPVGITCPPNQYGMTLRCPSGSSTFCNPTNFSHIVYCEDYSGEYIMTGASAAKSGARLAVHWPQVGTPTQSPAALSATVTRLDLIVQWIGSQARVGDWATAAASCARFTEQVAAIGWYGSYVSTNSQFQRWDWDHDVKRAMSDIKHVCDGLARIHTA